MPRKLLSDVVLPDSRVLGLESSDESVCFVLDAVFKKGHPHSRSPPTEGDPDACTRIRWCLRGSIHWNEGPHHPGHPGADASGGQDYGRIDTWIQSGNRHTLDGDWGCVVIDEPQETIEYLG